MIGASRRLPDSELVIGAAIGLTLEQVRPFLTSLGNSGYAGSTVLYAHPALARRLRRTPLARGVTLIRARQWLPYRFGLLNRPRTMRLFWEPLQAAIWCAMRVLGRIPMAEATRLNLRFFLGQLLYAPTETRYLKAYRFLKAHPHARVLLSDVRDVVFQSDPFATLPAVGLAVSIETSAYTIATEPFNAGWIERAYGSPMLAQIGGNRVSCSGVTHGDAEAMSVYLELMTREILSLSPKAAGVGGVDQAVHNVLLWTDRLGAVHPLEPLQSAVATLNNVDAATVKLSHEGRLINIDGSEPSVLHQYDRLPTLSPQILRAIASESLD